MPILEWNISAVHKLFRMVFQKASEVQMEVHGCRVELTSDGSDDYELLSQLIMHSTWWCILGGVEEKQEAEGEGGK